MGQPGVVVINEAFARLHFPNEDPIGRRILTGVLVEGDAGLLRDRRCRGGRALQRPARASRSGNLFLARAVHVQRQLAARADENDAKTFAPTLRRIVWSMDRDLPLENVQTMNELLGESIADSRFNTALLSLFAVVALLLAAIGIYGVLAFTVAQRTSEIGIRMALGAQRSSVLRLVVGNGLTLAVVGVAIGAAVALVATRSLQRLVFGVSTADPGVFAFVALVLTAVAATAAAIPALRASRVDPIDALRSE